MAINPQTKKPYVVPTMLVNPNLIYVGQILTIPDVIPESKDVEISDMVKMEDCFVTIELKVSDDSYKSVLVSLKKNSKQGDQVTEQLKIAGCNGFC